LSQNTLLAKLSPLIRSLCDLSLNLSGKLIAYDNVTLYKYTIVESPYKDRQKTLIDTITDLSIFIDFPGEVPLVNTFNQVATTKSVTFIEDFLPIIVIFPWSKDDQAINADVNDEFEFTLYDENKKETLVRFEIMERKSLFVEQHLYREYVVVPKRTDQELPTDVPVNDPNIVEGGEGEQIYSEYR